MREGGGTDERDDEAADRHEAESDPFAELGDDGGAPDDDPFAELDDEPLGERTPATDDDLFEEMDPGGLDDEDEVVERVLEGEAPTNGSVEGTPPGTGRTAEGRAGDAPTRDEVVVPKRRYCEGCQYFTQPPETACEHPGTEILELVDVDHFLVADCPVVEWRRDLEAYPDPDEATTDPRE